MPSLTAPRDRFTHVPPSVTTTTSGAPATSRPPSGTSSPTASAVIAAPLSTSSPTILGSAESHRVPVEPPSVVAAAREHGTADTKSPTPHVLNSSGTAHPPATPSNWMVRGTPNGGSPAALSALGTHTTHESAISGSSFASSAGNPTLSPLLHPRVGSGNGNATSMAAAHAASGSELAPEAESTDTAFYLMERAAGRKRTPRSLAISGAASSCSGGGGAAGTAGGDAEGATTPTSTRLVFSRRTSAGGSVYDGAGEDTAAAVRTGQLRLLPDSCAADDNADDSLHMVPDPQRGTDVQSTLHSSRSRGSGAATITTTPHSASPLTSSLPPLTLGAAMMGGLMCDVPATVSAAEAVTRRTSSSPLMAFAAAAGVVTPHPTTPTTAAITTAGATHTGSGSEIAAPVVPWTRRSRSPSSPRPPRNGSSSGSRTHESGSSGAARHTPRSAAAAAGTEPARRHPSSQHFAGSPSATGGTGVDVATPTHLTSHHFASTTQLPAWPHYSAASSCASLTEFGTAAEADATAAGDADVEERNEGAVQHRSGADTHARAAASSVTGVETSSSVPVQSFAASMTAPPHHSAETAVLSSRGATHAAKRREANPGDPHHHVEELSSEAPIPLADVWAAGSAASGSRLQTANHSRSSSCSAGEAPSHHHGFSSHHHHQQQQQTHAASRRSFTAPAISPATAAPVFTSSEAHHPSPCTAQAHNSGNFLNCRPAFSRFFSSRFSTPSGATTPPDASALDNSGRHEQPVVTCAGHPAAMPPPPPPPPTSRIPSPILRAAATITSGFAATPTHQRISSNLGTGGNATAQSSGRVTPSSGLHLARGSPAPPPPSPMADVDEATQPWRHCSASRASSSSPPLSDRCSAPRHSGAVEDTAAAGATGGLLGTPSTRALLSCRSTPDGMGGVETVVEGLSMMVLPPAALRPQPESGAAAPQGHQGHHHHNHHHSHPHGHHHHHRARDSSLGSCGGGSAAARNSPFARARPAAPPTALAMAQSREFLCTSESSLNTSTPQTLTSTASDPMLLSFSSANLAAPMTSTGSNNTNGSNWGVLSAQGGCAGTMATACNIVDSFVMRPDAETVQSLPRGKVPRMPGCSMRDWTAHLAAKEAENRRAQQLSHHSSGSARGSASGGGGVLSGPSSCSSAPPLSGFSSPASQQPPSVRGALPRMTPQEVAKHNTPDDLWMVIRNVVYDCTVFQRFHPGGEKLLLACAGRDATEVYDRFHAWVSCESFMGPYAVGVLAPQHQA